MLCALCVGQASALEYTMEAPDDYLFGRPTSDDTIYEWEDPNVDRSKNTALIPPGFGTPTSYLPGSGDPLTPNLIPGALDGGGLVSQTGSVNYPVIDTGNEGSSGQDVGYTAVTDDLYYSSGYLATLKIPSIGVNVKVYEGTVIGTYRTSANGSFTVTGCKPGTYIIEELSSDGTHVIDTPPQTVYLSGEEQEVVQVYFGNSPKGSLLIKKVSSADNSPISDVQFFVTESDGTVVGNSNGYFTTDSAGTILIDNIDPGTTLVAKEVKAKEGFLLDDTPQTAQIKAGQTTTLEFRNKPMGNLVIEKWGRNYSKVVPVQFRVIAKWGHFS